MKKHYERLRLLLGDQLDIQHSWFNQTDNATLYLLAEMRQETDYTRHHVQKICAFFAAMRGFAEALREAGHHVLYLGLDDTADYENFTDLLCHLAKRFNADEVAYQLPDEYRLQQQLSQLESAAGWPANTAVSTCDSEHFLLGRNELVDYFEPNKHHKMEFFYRKMRKRFGWLMDNDEPAGGKWNYDADNRNKLGTEDIDNIPEPLCFDNDVSDILQALNQHGVQTIGNPCEKNAWPLTREQSLTLLDDFCERLLENFGRFQDAMTCNSDKKWSLYHARLSFSMNCKLLRPAEVIDTAIATYEARKRNKKKNPIDIAQIEGFVRQVAGWREYVRGVYWVNMPAYAECNALDANRDLPDFFWTGKTRMRCLAEVIGQSLDYAYAHHIQRLMITGNFCLLAGIDPRQVDDWYLGIYNDAIEWVEMPNTRGMSQFADGGIVGTKPYAASGNYVNKMSDYCKSCHYKASQKTGESACPLNSMYWHFMLRHRDRLGNNPRTAMPYRNWDKRSSSEQDAVLEDAKAKLQGLDKL
ncbi:MAG: cryptochrome/photolyase family protein [Gammaproteobacteria bacterium]|nr:cryptochrome/photolyase family protein [Gammaproteobacteria bacterium]